MSDDKMGKQGGQQQGGQQGGQQKPGQQQGGQQPHLRREAQQPAGGLPVHHEDAGQVGPQRVHSTDCCLLNGCKGRVRDRQVVEPYKGNAR